jgi:hypothetical protein
MVTDDDWGDLTPEQQEQQDEQLIRDVERRHPEWADIVRRNLELRRRLASVEAELPDDVKRELARELAEVDRERLLTPAELLADARRIMHEANERASRLMRRFDELTGFEPDDQK